MQLKDKVIIITGGCQGLGRAMAEYLAAKGAKLALVDLNPEKLELAVAACQAHGVEARAYLCNVADEEQVTQTVAQIAEDFRAINGLVNNAGILRDGLLLKVKDGVMTKMSLAQWQAVIDVNLTGVFLCTREVAAKMIELNSQGAIINISSISRAGKCRPDQLLGGQGRGCGGNRDLGQGAVALRHSGSRDCTWLYRNRNDPGHEARSPGKNDLGHPAQAHGQG